MSKIDLIVGRKKRRRILLLYFSQEVRTLIDLAYSNDIQDKREAINKINELEARCEIFVIEKNRIYKVKFLFSIELVNYLWVSVH